MTSRTLSTDFDDVEEEVDFVEFDEEDVERDVFPTAAPHAQCRGVAPLYARAFAASTPPMSRR